MAITTIFLLLALCAWLSAKLMGANRDNEELRKRVQSLRRQILHGR